MKGKKSLNYFDTTKSWPTIFVNIFTIFVTRRHLHQKNKLFHFSSPTYWMGLMGWNKRQTFYYASDFDGTIFAFLC
jgi:hypothetical protein